MDGPKTKSFMYGPFVTQITHWFKYLEPKFHNNAQMGKSQEKMATVQKDKMSLLGMPLASPGIQK